MDVVNDLFSINRFRSRKAPDIIAGVNLAGVTVKLDLFGENSDLAVGDFDVAPGFGNIHPLIVFREVAVDIEVLYRLCLRISD